MIGHEAKYTYPIKTVCSNCANVENHDVPKRIRISDYLEYTKCVNCDCDTLQNKPLSNEERLMINKHLKTE